MTPETSPENGSGDFFREVNERIRELGECLGLGEHTLELVCECGDTTCTERVSITCAEYKHVRTEPGRHVVIAGHERDGHVVTRNDRYVVSD